MVNKVKTAREALKGLHDGAVIMIGGFAGAGSPNQLCAALAEMGYKDLTVISCDAGRAGIGAGALLRKGQVKTLYASHVGVNTEVGSRKPGDVVYDVEYHLIPQGTLVEQIRAGGVGLGGVITPVGLGTVVAEGKSTIEIRGKTYLVEEPFHAEFALIRGSIVDKSGNVFYNMATRNFNPVMAMAADHVIVGAEKVVEVGTLDPNYIMTPGILVESIVEGEEPCWI
ncbi:butyryl-CoA:acetoacetate CoA-transferase alpha subunit [Oscillibacter sp. PC13]|uniref:CoA transferase subunit A n=1 Tax=Oscillibacter sp. PC13 TaxID=1855299 RepID=UPI0008F105C7|nr:3-oxoacid CoA-transferase subunit A [Oscillibacter sp. PC13]SFO95938.1 butyryl-CoA:acetoacetate CoA-transferase alpha subunit [Oscillibacter sp. PC13]